MEGKNHTTASLGFLVTYITFTFFSSTCGLLGFTLKRIFRKIIKGTRDPGIEYFNVIENFRIIITKFRQYLPKKICFEPVVNCCTGNWGVNPHVATNRVISVQQRKQKLQ